MLFSRWVSRNLYFVKVKKQSICPIVHLVSNYTCLSMLWGIWECYSSYRLSLYYVVFYVFSASKIWSYLGCSKLYITVNGETDSYCKSKVSVLLLDTLGVKVELCACPRTCFHAHSRMFTHSNIPYAYIFLWQ